MASASPAIVVISLPLVFESLETKIIARVSPAFARSIKMSRPAATKKSLRKSFFCRSDSAAPLMMPKSSLTEIAPLLSASASLIRSKTSTSHFSTLPSPARQEARRAAERTSTRARTRASCARARAMREAARTVGVRV